MSASRPSIDCDGDTGRQVVADLRDNPFPGYHAPKGVGGIVRMVGGIRSECRAASNRNRWATYIGIRKYENGHPPKERRHPEQSEGSTLSAPCAEGSGSVAPVNFCGGAYSAAGTTRLRLETVIALHGHLCAFNEARNADLLCLVCKPCLGARSYCLPGVFWRF